MHTSPFEHGHSTSLTRILRLGPALDVLGWNSRTSPGAEKLWNRKTVEEIEEEYPRIGFEDVFSDMMRKEHQKKPGCLTSQKVR